MLRSDSHTESVWSGAKPQRRVELCCLAVDPGRDRAVGADLERRCGPLLDGLMRAPRAVFRIAIHGSADPGQLARDDESRVR